MLCGQVREEVYAAEALHVFEWAVVMEVVAPLALEMAAEATALAAAEIPRIQRSLCGNIDREVQFLFIYFEARERAQVTRRCCCPLKCGVLPLLRALIALLELRPIACATGDAAAGHGLDCVDSCAGPQPRRRPRTGRP